jgi:hypothetical protein
MVTIRLRLESDTLHLAELRPLIGKTVEISIKEDDVPEITPGTGDWDAAKRAALALRESGYDFDAWRLQREFDLAHAGDHIR